MRGLKQSYVLTCVERGRRTFTGAWIETYPRCRCTNPKFVAPLQVRGLKPTVFPAASMPPRVAPLQVRGLKLAVEYLNNAC